MDDLGSDYSSLQRLLNLQFNIIKIDQTLLSKIRTTPLQTLCLIETILQIGNDFESRVVVEGLENIDMIEAVFNLGARFGQGYGLGKPMPADQIINWKKNFKVPIEKVSIKSYLGALAYHLKFIRKKNYVHNHKVESYPLTKFFKEEGLEDNEIFTWHRLIHSGIEVKRNSNKLLDWLNQKAKLDI
jgi:hypothetical protein